MPTSHSRSSQDHLFAKARIEFEALGFIPYGTAAVLAAHGVDVPALEERYTTAVYR